MSSLARRARSGSSTNERRLRRQLQGPALGLEQLDGRQMLSANPMTPSLNTQPLGTNVLQTLGTAASPTVSLSTGVLTITGTAGDDSIELRQNGNRIEIVGTNGKAPQVVASGAIGKASTPLTTQRGVVSVPITAVQQVKIAMGAGNDTSVVRFGQSCSERIQNVSINSGAGNDTVRLDVDSKMATRVFADLGAGRDTMVLPAGMNLGGQREVETVTQVFGGWKGNNGSGASAPAHDVVDQNGDGALNKEEFVACRRLGIQFIMAPTADMWAPIDAGFRAEFDKLDTNGNGSLSRDEFDWINEAFKALGGRDVFPSAAAVLR